MLNYKGIFKGIFKGVLTFIIASILYIAVVLLYGTYRDYQPANNLPITVIGTPTPPPLDSIYQLLTWNIGYGGLGEESSFFFDAGGYFTDAGAQVRPTKSQNKRYLNGIQKVLKQHPVDFLLLQEVDVNAKRSYYQNQYKTIAKSLGNHQLARTFAPNYKVPFVPLPLLQPWKAWGTIYSGLGTYSRYPIQSATRIQLPGNYGWPARIFQLDRCVSLQTIPVPKGTIYLLNIHNSAFDSGDLRKQQLVYIQKIALECYQKDTQENQKNYVIIGGDWNQYLPHFTPTKGFKTLASQTQIPHHTFPREWQWVYDKTQATNREVARPYDSNNTQKSLIDGFVLSPNIVVKTVKTVDLDFKYSDHQPVQITIGLK